MSPPKEKARLGGGPSQNFDNLSVPFVLDVVYPVPSAIDGGQRSFCLDIPEMDAASIAAELYGCRLRLAFESDPMNWSWLRRRLYLLTERRAELRRRAAA